MDLTSEVEFYGTSIRYHRPKRTITVKVSTDRGYLAIEKAFKAWIDDQIKTLKGDDRNPLDLGEDKG